MSSGPPPAWESLSPDERRLLDKQLLCIEEERHWVRLRDMGLVCGTLDYQGFKRRQKTYRAYLLGLVGQDRRKEFHRGFLHYMEYRDGGPERDATSHFVQQLVLEDYLLEISLNNTLGSSSHSDHGTLSPATETGRTSPERQQAISPPLPDESAVPRGDIVPQEFHSPPRVRRSIPRYHSASPELEYHEEANESFPSRKRSRYAGDNPPSNDDEEHPRRPTRRRRKTLEEKLADIQTKLEDAQTSLRQTRRMLRRPLPAQGRVDLDA